MFLENMQQTWERLSIKFKPSPQFQVNILQSLILQPSINLGTTLK
jgi:hypothetical protein